MDYVGILSWNVNEICGKLKEHVGISMGYLEISMEYVGTLMEYVG